MWWGWEGAEGNRRGTGGGGGGGQEEAIVCRMRWSGREEGWKGEGVPEGGSKRWWWGGMSRGG